MSKTAEQVALDAVSGFWAPCQPSISGAIVSALRSAGWLRSTANVEDLCPGCYDRVHALTRERDEARAGARNYWRTRYEEVFGELAEARASAASPEVMRVLKAVERLRNHWNKQDDWDAVDEFHAAADALSASRQPKARFRAVLHCGHWEVHEYAENDVVIPRIMRLTQEQAERIADILNGEGGGK